MMWTARSYCVNLKNMSLFLIEIIIHHGKICFSRELCLSIIGGVLYVHFSSSLGDTSFDKFGLLTCSLWFIANCGKISDKSHSIYDSRKKNKNDRNLLFFLIGEGFNYLVATRTSSRDPTLDYHWKENGILLLLKLWEAVKGFTKSTGCDISLKNVILTSCGTVRKFMKLFISISNIFIRVTDLSAIGHHFNNSMKTINKM